MSNIGAGARHELDQQVLSKFRKVANENASLGVHDRVVSVDIDTASVVLTLPNVGEAAGKIFTVSVDAVTGAAANNCTITDNGESKNWADIVSTDDTPGQVAVLYSDGESWFQLITSV